MTDRDWPALVAQFHADRAQIDAAHPPCDPDTNRCRYCGGRWMRWRSDRSDRALYDGHVRCLVSPAFQRAVLAAYQQLPPIPMSQIAHILGVSAHMVRAWVFEAQGLDRQGSPRRRRRLPGKASAPLACASSGIDPDTGRDSDRPPCASAE